MEQRATREHLQLECHCASPAAQCAWHGTRICCYAGPGMLPCRWGRCRPVCPEPLTLNPYPSWKTANGPHLADTLLRTLCGGRLDSHCPQCAVFLRADQPSDRARTAPTAVTTASAVRRTVRAGGKSRRCAHSTQHTARRPGEGGCNNAACATEESLPRLSARGAAQALPHACGSSRTPADAAAHNPPTHDDRPGRAIDSS